MNKYIVQVIPITGVHIGTGNEYSPLDYVIKEDSNGKEVYMKFSPEKIIGKLEAKDREQLINYLEEDKIEEINQIIFRHVSEENSNYTSTVTSGLFNKYKKKLGDIDNQLLVSAMYRNQSNYNPVIPGSSIKGSIRTAVVSDIAQNIKNIKNTKNPEKEILGFDDAKNDPFRNLLISDCEITGKKVERIADFVNFKEKRNKTEDFSKMQIIKEHITGVLLKGDAKGDCEITIKEDICLTEKNIPNWKPVKIKLDLKKVINSCNSFYFKNLNDEYNNFYKNSSHPILQENGKKLIELIDGLINKDKNECLIRVGQFSQIENVTIDEHRKPWNPKGFGKTRTLTECNFPLGWAKLRFLSLDEARELKKQKEAEKKQNEIKERILKEEIEKIKLEKEKKERIEKERLENMTPDERMIEEINDFKILDLNEKGQKISKIVNSVFDGEYSKSVYQMLKKKLEQLGEWKPSGMKVKKLRMAERNQKILSKIE